jgi:hypothetical protein
MKDLFRFAVLLSDVAPRIERINGRFFLNREECERDALVAKIESYPDEAVAQQWINMVPIDDLLDLVAGDWDMNDPALEAIAKIYERSWLAIISSTYGNQVGLSVELLKDTDSGDVIVRLSQGM